MTRQSLPGPFSATRLHSGVWQLTAEVADGARVYLHGAGPEASKLLSGMRITALEFEWRTEDVMVRVSGADGVRHFSSDSVFIHTPKTRLYESLPLASFDRDAQRFWKRVFRLIRIPGGRLILGAIARRRGRRGTASH
ncbi:MAG TPA: hypothetical protein VN325_07280 [Steroidobacteraceae bacterium]|nr:hypothetical protein [Steroidobacteraceae bacterium]